MATMDTMSVQGDASRAVTPRYQPLVLVAGAVCAGIVADRYAGWPVLVWWTAGALGWGVWWALRRLQRDSAAGVTILLAAAACAGAWHHCRWNLFERDDLGLYARPFEQPICVEAVALSGARRVLPSPPNPMHVFPSRDRTRVELEVTAVRNGGDWRPACGRARLTVEGRLPELRAGDRLRVVGQLTGPQPPHNPGEFDFAAHYRADRLRSLLRAECPECVTTVEPGSRWSVRRSIDVVRNCGDQLLWQSLDPRRAGVASAVLIGCREEVTVAQTEAFVQTGTVHILSISGMHVGILAALVLMLTRLLPMPRGTALLATALIVVAYTLLTGAEPPAVRAAILVLVMCGAHWLGRRPLAMNSLGAAALAVLALNPADLFRVGVQLSFLCMMVLMWVGSISWPRDERRDPLRRLLHETRPWPIRLLSSAGRWIWEMTLVGIAIWLVTTPLVLARFHIFSPIAVVLNTFLWLPMAAALWSGVAALLVGAACPGAAPPLGWLCDRTIALLQWGIDTARLLPGSYRWMPGPADWWLAGFYGGLGILLACPRLCPPRRWLAAIAAAWVAVGVCAPWVSRDRPHVTCTFVSLGHGCGAVLRFPSGATILYDAGSLTSPAWATNAISSTLWSQGVTHLDAMVLSHADGDHYNAVPGLLERFSVGVIYVPPGMFRREEVALNALDEAIRKAGVPLRETFSGDRLRTGSQCRIEVLHPPRRGIIGSDNANSLVLAVEYLGHRILLPGDLERPGLDDVLAEEPMHCDVLLAPHHGSRGSDPPGLARWCTPQWVVVSGSRTFKVDQTTATYQSMDAQVMHTAETGAVTVRIDDHGVSVTPWIIGPE